MRPGLLWRDGDLDLTRLPAAWPSLVADLGLERLYEAMARDDPFILEVARRVVPAGLEKPDEVRHRQAVLRDAIASSVAIRELYAIAGNAVETERSTWGAGLRSPELAMRRSVGVLAGLLDNLRALRSIVEGDWPAWTSNGLTAFAATVRAAVDDRFLATAGELLASLDARTVVATVRLGEGNRGVDYVLRRTPDGGRRLRDRIAAQARTGLVVDVTLRDQNALNALAELRAQALASTGAAVGDATAQVLGFFRSLRTELAFVVGCLNLHETLTGGGVATCFPVVAPGVGRAFEARDLSDPGLALGTTAAIVGNDVSADGCGLVVVTGANGGGKSTLLRAVGVAQVMLQAGMFVAARELRAGPRSNVLTHFTREEEAGLDAGRLEAELRRLSALIDDARPTSLVLLNESLSSTNERDGSVIAAEVVTALADAGATVWYVTHLHELARSIEAMERADTVFLRAERGAGGERSFRVVEAPPLETSFGRDVYERVVRRPGEV